MADSLLMFFPERLNLHIHARRQIELHQRVHRLLRRLENIEQALVGADFKLLPRLLIHVRRSQHAVLVLHRGQRNRSRDLRAGTFCRLHDLARRLIQNAVVVGFQPNANSFFSSHCSLSLPLPANPEGKIWRQATSREFSCSCSAGLPPAVVRASRPRNLCRRDGGAAPYVTISAIVPAPTVCPPSRIANRNPFSIATGVISSITRLTLSPGITISVPPGHSAIPEI